MTIKIEALASLYSEFYMPTRKGLVGSWTSTPPIAIAMWSILSPDNKGLSNEEIKQAIFTECLALVQNAREPWFDTGQAVTTGRDECQAIKAYVDFFLQFFLEECNGDRAKLKGMKEEIINTCDASIEKIYHKRVDKGGVSPII